MSRHLACLLACLPQRHGCSETWQNGQQASSMKVCLLVATAYALTPAPFEGGRWGPTGTWGCEGQGTFWGEEGKGYRYPRTGSGSGKVEQGGGAHSGRGGDEGMSRIQCRPTIAHCILADSHQATVTVHAAVSIHCLMCCAVTQCIQ